MVNFMFDALGKDGHYRVLRANNARREKQGVSTMTPYWGFRLALKPGEDVDAKGEGGSSEVTRIVTDIPRGEITDEFLASHHVGDYRQLVQDEIKASDHSIAWSMQVSQEIYGGTEEPETAIDSSVDTSDFDDDFQPLHEMGLEDRKPVAKPQPSNSLKPLPDAELAKIAGSANLAQRRAQIGRASCRERV